MNPALMNIIESLVGSWCLVDCETTSLDPETGALISVGFLPFSIIQDPTGKPELIISTQYKPEEVWFFNAEVIDQMNVPQDTATMQWHRNRNPAFAHYRAFYIEAAEADFDSIAANLIELFKNNKCNFISRHAFDANWLKKHWPDVFNSIHYRNFYDIASLLRGMGFQNEKLYRQIQESAKRRAMHIQRSASFPGVPHSSVYVEHRPFTDTLIDMCILEECLNFIWNCAKVS